MNRGFKKEMEAVPHLRIKACREEICQALGLKSSAQFYRKRNGQVRLNPAEKTAVKEIISKYKS